MVVNELVGAGVRCVCAAKHLVYGDEKKMNGIERVGIHDHITDHFETLYSQMRNGLMR